MSSSCPRFSDYTYKTQNFLADPKGNDTNLRIYDRAGNLRFNINPTNSYFYSKERYVYIKQEGLNSIALDFKTEQEALKAILLLNKAKAKFYTIEQDSKDYYTKTELDGGILFPINDPRYVNIDGDTMTGDLIIQTLQGGEIVNMNIDQMGQLIRGNQTLSVTENLSSPNYIDSFNKSIDFSVFWEYAVKDTSSGINLRAGSIVAAWDDVSNTISHSHTSTMDIGDTTGIDFNVDMDGSNTIVRLYVNITSGNWTIKLLRRFV